MPYAATSIFRRCRGCDRCAASVPVGSLLTLGAAWGQVGRPLELDRTCMRRFSWLVFCALLAACQPGGVGKVTSDPPVSLVVGDDIATTSLDAAAPSVPAAGGIDLPDLRNPIAGTVDASIAVETPVEEAASDIATPLAAESVATSAEDTPSDADAPAVEEPVELKSASQLRCEARGGVYASAGGEGVRACVRKTRDAGKSCRREGDCDGQCLARSQTCSPIDPVLGCNEVLQQNGAMVTLCLN